MKLSFLGASYEAHFDDIQVTDTEQIGTYRGAPLQRKSFKAPSQPPHQRVQLTYRGVRYKA